MACVSPVQIMGPELVMQQRADAAITAARSEYKYCLPGTAALPLVWQLNHRLPGHRFLGDSANLLPSPQHFITTVYFDTPDQRLFLSALTSPTDNIKLRVKDYYDRHPDLASVASGLGGMLRSQSWVWMEIKRRNGGKTFKQRARVLRNEVLKLISGEREWPAALLPEVKTFAQLGGGIGLVPSVLVNYRRLSWQNAVGTLRITLDLDVGFYSVPRLNWDNHCPLHKGLLGSRVAGLEGVLLEVKQRGDCPAWLEILLRDLGATRTNLSKFEKGSESIYGAG